MSKGLSPKDFDPTFLIAFIREHSLFNADLLQQIIDDWKAYKSTGLSPEETVQLVEEAETRFLIWYEQRYGDASGKMIEWIEAYREGRLVILDRPKSKSENQ